MFEKDDEYDEDEQTVLVVNNKHKSAAVADSFGSNWSYHCASQKKGSSAPLVLGTTTEVCSELGLTTGAALEALNAMFNMERFGGVLDS